MAAAAGRPHGGRGPAGRAGHRADLRRTDLRRTDLRRADPRGADLIVPTRGVPAPATACPVEPRTAATACCLRGSWGPPAPWGGAVGRTGLDGEDPLVGGCGGFPLRAAARRTRTRHQDRSRGEGQ
ncbi:pentapeptide repeat-containing protein [Streptomyces parvus]|uniref:pentapeptide repeat-containing protein n=1 Tax=Streptomyces parvus TaxID=66428 RepID=UPI00382A64C9